jgi:hypothetical protein
MSALVLDVLARRDALVTVCSCGSRVYGRRVCVVCQLLAARASRVVLDVERNSA